MCDVVLKCRITTLKFWQIAILHLFKTRVSGKLGFYFEQKITIGTLKWNAQRTTTQYKISSLISILSAASKTFENSVWHKWTVFWGVFWAAHFGSFLLKMDRKKQQLDLSTVISVFFHNWNIGHKNDCMPCSIKVDCNPVLKEPKNRDFQVALHYE